MGRVRLLACVLTSTLAVAPAATAATQTARSGNVTATFTFKGKYPTYTGEVLTIAQNGTAVYHRPVISRLCGKRCAPGSSSGKQASVHAVDLEHSGRPDVVLDLFSAGAHCCSIEQVFAYDPSTKTYAKTERNFGDPGDRIVDLKHDRRYEFLTADDAFAGAFTSYAASGLPIQILSFSHRHFVNVTRSYPRLIATDAAVWLRLFKRHYHDGLGVIAAWAADEELLGHSGRVNRYLAAQLKAGHLKSPLSPEEPGGRKFVAKLQRFLRAHGYLHQ